MEPLVALLLQVLPNGRCVLLCGAAAAGPHALPQVLLRLSTLRVQIQWHGLAREVREELAATWVAPGHRTPADATRRYRDYTAGWKAGPGLVHALDSFASAVRRLEQGRKAPLTQVVVGLGSTIPPLEAMCCLDPEQGLAEPAGDMSRPQPTSWRG